MYTDSLSSAMPRRLHFISRYFLLIAALFLNAIFRRPVPQAQHNSLIFSFGLRYCGWAVLNPFQHLHKQPSKVDFPIKNLRNIECKINEMKNRSSLGSCGADARPRGLSI
jgi:hypothetical protein